MMSIKVNSPELPYAKSTYRNTQANIPNSKVFLNPNFLKNTGSNNINNTSEICPSVIFPVGFSKPIPDRKGLAF